jgi:hypothetical protein
MADGPRALDLEILRKGHPEDTIQVVADPKGSGFPAVLQKQLRSWLAGHKWAESRWGEFEMIAREAEGWKPLAKVRA